AVRTQRPAVAEGDHRAVLRAPVLVVEADLVAGDDVAAVDGGGARGRLEVGGVGLPGLGPADVDGEGEQAGGEGAAEGVHGGSLIGGKGDAAAASHQSAIDSETSMFPRVALE